MKNYQIHLMALAILVLVYRIPKAKLFLQGLFEKICDVRLFRISALILVFILTSVMGVIKTQALDFGAFDQGIFQQVLYSISHGLGFQYTLEYGNRSYLATHFAPYLALIAPFFRLSGNSNYFLVVLNSLLIWGGVWAWVKQAVGPVKASRA